MKQTPAHDLMNPDLLRLMRPNFNLVVEVGASSGALAREYRKINPYGRYVGIEIDADYAELAKRHCTEVIVGNIEHFSDDTFAALSNADCWVFPDVLEHLYDPWELLKKIKRYIHANTEIIACIPNSQHWSMQTSLCAGMFQYQSDGLLDKTHIRFFTRQTMVELFQSTGYTIIGGEPRIFNYPPEPITAAIKSMAEAIGADPEQSVQDAIPLQWIIRATPLP